jgi:hypothetical protein
MFRLRSSPASAALLLASLLAACGGGGGGGGEITSSPTLIANGSTIVGIGESKTITAGVGDTVTLLASEPVQGWAVGTTTLEAPCNLTWSPDGSLAGKSEFTVTILAGTVACNLRCMFADGNADLRIEVHKSEPTPTP